MKFQNLTERFSTHGHSTVRDLIISFYHLFVFDIFQTFKNYCLYNDDNKFHTPTTCLYVHLFLKRNTFPLRLLVKPCIQWLRWHNMIHYKKTTSKLLFFLQYICLAGLHLSLDNISQILLHHIFLFLAHFWLKKKSF